MSPTIVATVAYAASTGWAERARVVDTGELSGVGCIRRLMRETRGAETIVLDGSSGVRGDLAVAAVLRFARRHLQIILVDSTWKAGKGWMGGLRRLGVKAFDSPRTSYGVLSDAERSVFPSIWGVAADRVFKLPWYVRIPDEEGATETEDRLVFAGGDSLRDFATLLAAADGGNFNLGVASRSLSANAAAGLTNVKIASLSHTEFLTTLRKSAVLMVPLEDRTDRSAGQQTYLRAMAIGIPVVVTDVLGVEEYIDHGRTGWLVPAGDANALRDRLEWTLEPANAEEVQRVTQAAIIDVERFSPEACVDALWAWINRDMASVSPSQGIR